MKIICIGRNYPEHAQELKQPLPTAPLFFLKPETCLIYKDHPFFYPQFSKEIHHEVELVIKISKQGRHIQEKFASTYYDQIGIGLDLTARDLQKECIEKGLPWEIAKAFDYSAPVSKLIPKDQFENIYNVDFRLDVNGRIAQQGNSSQMIFSFEKIISYVSQFITLKLGDLIFTGTPPGVKPIVIGNRMEAYIQDKKMMDFMIK